MYQSFFVPFPSYMSKYMPMHVHLSVSLTIVYVDIDMDLGTSCFPL